MKVNVMILLLCFCCAAQVFAQEKQVLIFHETEGFRHNSIENGIQAIQAMANEIGFKSEVSRDSRYFTDNDLSALDLIIFLNTTGNILNLEEQNAFQNYMDQGGNFFGIHAAADTEHNWSWYVSLVGAAFTGHPEIQEAVIHVNMSQHSIVNFLPEKKAHETF